MTELKTIKDLKHYNFQGILRKNGVAIDERELKTETIKTIKRLRETMDKDFFCLKCNIGFDVLEDKCKHFVSDNGILCNGVLCNADYEATDSKGIIKFLMWKYDLTEEDLK